MLKRGDLCAPKNNPNGRFAVGITSVHLTVRKCVFSQQLTVSVRKANILETCNNRLRRKE